VTVLVAAPVLVPLLAAAVALLVRRPAAQRAISIAALAVATAAAVALLVRAWSGDVADVARLGGWPGSFAITFVADRLAAVLVLVSMATMALVLVYAVGQRGADERSSFYHPVYLVLAAGVSQAFLAGDLFNLFVAFEILLMASYVLITLEGTNAQVRSGTTYVVLNVLESMVLLAAVGLVFAATGTVSMAELPERLAALPDGVRNGLNLLLLLAFGIKAAVFPLFFWLPDAYPTAPSSVSAIFAGLLTKVGVYCLIRTQTLLFPGGFGDLLVVVGAATMVVGVLGAISHRDMKRILSFHIVSQIGYMVTGLGIGGTAALAATIFFLVHQIPVKTSLFLVEGIVSRDAGSSSFDSVGGLARRSPWLAALFLLPALSIAGIPPFSGFVAKFALVSAGFGAGQHVVTAVALAVSLLTLVSMVKIWVGAFWGEPTGAGSGALLARCRTMGSATAVVVAATVAVALAAGPLMEFSTAAAEQLLDAGGYARSVVSP